MNWLRRLLGRSEPPVAPAVAPAPAPVADGEIMAADPLPVTETRPLPADGQTRPLPNEPAPEITTGQHIVFAQASDVGMVRSNNQDAAVSFFSVTRSADERPDFGLFAIADGMGGHHDGEKASALAVRTLLNEVMTTVFLPMLNGTHHQNDTPTSELLVAGSLKANAAVMRQVPDGGTTLTAITIIGDLAYVSHVGDSRVYFINADRIEQVTRDHSLVQRLIELDQLTPAEAADHPQKNVLYRALGQTETLEIDILTRRLSPHSRLLICSDGLWNLADDRELREIVMRNSDPQTACDQLVALANSRGGVDNITAILLHIPG